MAETLDTFRDLNEGAELRGAQNLALDDVADAVLGEEGIPDIGLELLDAKRQAAVLRLDAENDGLTFSPFLRTSEGCLMRLVQLRFETWTRPSMPSSISMKAPKSVRLRTRPSMMAPMGYLFFELLPGVFLQLLHAERDAAVAGIDAEDDGVDLVAGLDQLRRMLHALGPGHLGDVNESLDSLLELDERAVVGDREDAAADLCADGVALGRVEPWVRRELLEAERDALLILVELEHLDLDLVAYVDEVAGMGQTAPAHVGDVEQAIEAAQIDERAVVGEVLDGAGEDASLFEGGEGDRLLGVLVLFEQLLAGDDDVAALLVELDDADFDLGADVAVEIADRANLNLRAGQECLDADVDGETALDAAENHTLDRSLGVGSLFELVPDLVAEGLVVADEVAAFGLFALNDHLDGVAGLELGDAVDVEDLLEGNEPFGLEADVDDDVLVGDLDDGAGDDDLFGGEVLRGCGLGCLLAVEVGQRGGEVGGVVVGLVVRRLSAWRRGRARMRLHG